MARKQDLLFCKIAIAHGMVTQTQAQKVLAHIEKRERESGKRPRIGTVFAKADLIDGDQVRTIYEAINKRMGGGGSRVAAPAGRRSSARRSRRARESVRPARREIDPQTLWTGIGFGIVFLVVIGIIVFLFIRQNSRPDPSLAESSASEASTTPASQATSKPATSGSGGQPPEEGGSPTGLRKISPEQKHQLQQMVGDVRRDLGEDPRRGLELLGLLQGDLAFLGENGHDTSAYSGEVADLERELNEAIAASSARDEVQEMPVVNEEPEVAVAQPKPEKDPAPEEAVDDEKSSDGEELDSLDDFFDE